MKIRTPEKSAVDEEELVSESLFRLVRAAYISIYLDYRCFCADIHDLAHNAASEQVLYSVFQRLGRFQDVNVLTVVHQSESDFRSCQSDSGEFFYDMTELDIVRLHEFSAGRDVVEQVPDGEVGADRSGYFLSRNVLGISKFHLATDLIPVSTGLQRNFRDCRDGGQCFPAESECRYVVQVFGCRYLGSRVSFETQHRLIRRHAAPVVYDLDQCSSGVGENHCYLRGSCIHSVFHEFLDCRCRSLYDLAGSYHIRYVAWQYPYIHGLTTMRRTW